MCAVFTVKNILWSLFTHFWNLEADSKNVLITLVSAKIVETSLKRLSLEANILAWKYLSVLTHSMWNLLLPEYSVKQCEQKNVGNNPQSGVVTSTHVGQAPFWTMCACRHLDERKPRPSKWWGRGWNTGHHPPQLCNNLAPSDKLSLLK